MKKTIILFLIAVFCWPFLSFTASATEIIEYDTAADNANSWRYKDGQPINNQYSITPFYIPSHPDATLTGIDVSHHQGQIDWEKVKQSDVDFVIIRCGFAEDKPEYDDRYWEYNVSECERLGIPYGVYLYSYAENVEDALSEADHVLRMIDGKNLSMPVYYDLEENNMIETGMDFAAVATAFCEKITASGYPVGIYANLNWWTYYLTDDCFNNWYKWVAHWNENCGYQGQYAMWQYGCTGIVDGIEGNVDMNFLIGTPDDHKGWTEKLDTPDVNLSIDSVNDKPFLNWNAVTDAEEYQVWRKTEDNKYSLYTTVTETSLLDSDVSDGETYYYIVKAVCFDKQKGNSYFSDEKCITLPIKEVVRIAGSTRYETSIAIAKATKEEMGVDKFNTIIIASGEGFADALAGSYLAKVKEAPILMSSGSNDNQLKEYVSVNLAANGTVYILGGTVAVKQNTEDALKTIPGITVKRLKGADRYLTNMEILKEAGVTNEDILVATGINFADSLSASAVGKPILLVDGKKTLSTAQKAYLESLSTSNIYILGGTGAVGENYDSELSEYGIVERIKGESRHETSVAVANKFFTNPSSAVTADAWNFPDGMCGGPLAMTMDAPLILTKSGDYTAAKTYIQENNIEYGYVLGGTVRIDDASVMDIFNIDIITVK